MDPREDVPTKLAAARARLLLEHPFIGALVMHLPLIAARGAWCTTTATDARAFFYSREFISSLSLAQTQFVLAHEALHCALGHFARRSHRDPVRWDIACDHAVNLLLADERMHPPAEALLNAAYRGLAAEEIYPLIARDTHERSFDLHIFAGAAARPPHSASGGSTVDERRRGCGDNPALAPTTDGWDAAGNEAKTQGEYEPASPALDEREQLGELWQSRVALAAQRTRYAGYLGKSWSRAIDRLLQPRLPWRALLARHVMSVARDDYSYRRASRRDGDALLPALRSDEVDLFVALDSSGSISDDELWEFAAEVEALKGQIRARVTLHACDERLDAEGPWYFGPSEPLVLPRRIGGGGGTSFAPVFEWIADRRLRPDLLVYFTDGEGTFPARAPDYPVIWLVKGKAEVPWGERIQLN